VDVAQDCIITEEDCGTKNGIKVRAIIDAGTVVASLASRILGRTTAEDVKDPTSSKTLIKRATLLTEPEVDVIVTGGVQELKIRSVLTCEAANGVCGACYGRDLARGTPANMGEAVGIVPGPRRSTGGRRSVSSPRNRSVSRVPSSPCAPSTSAVLRRSPSS